MVVIQLLLSQNALFLIHFSADHEIGSKSMASLCAAIKYNALSSQSLKFVDLKGCALSKSAVDVLRKGMEANTSLQAFHLDVNTLSSNDRKRLAEDPRINRAWPILSPKINRVEVVIFCVQYYSTVIFRGTLIFAF